MTSSPVQNCFSDDAGATIRIVKGEWDTSNGGGAPSTDPQPRLSVSIPSSQLQFQPYGYGYGYPPPPQVQLLSTSTSQYPSAEDLSGRRGSSLSSKRSKKGVENADGNGIQKSASPRTSSDRAAKKKHTSTNGPTPAAPATSPKPEPEQQHQNRPDNDPKETRPSHKPTKERATTNPKVQDEKPPRPRPQKRRRKPTPKLTTHQIFYIFVIDGLGAMILSGAINFAIAYAMYTSHPSHPGHSTSPGSDDATPPILLFHLPNSLAGDAAVTIILQTVITWLVEFFLVRRDIERGGVAPVGFVPLPGMKKSARVGLGKEKGKETAATGGYDTDMDLEKGHGNLKGSGGEDGKGTGDGKLRRKSWSWSWRGFVRWFCFITDNDDDADLSTNKNHNPTTKEPKSDESNHSRGITESLSIIGSQILRALLISVIMFFLLWGPFIGVLMALGRKDDTIGAKGDWVFDSRVWLPQVFKLILGGLLALLETPAFAFFWMVRGGWEFDFQAQARDRDRNQSGLGGRMDRKAASGNGHGTGNGEGVVGTSAVGDGVGDGRRMSLTDEEV